MSDKFRSPYPGYNVLDKWDSPSWNEQTRDVVRKRLQEVPSRQFLNEEEWVTLEAVCERLIPQPDRPEHPVPLVPWIDQRLAQQHWDGYRFEHMPPMRQSWRLGIAGINEESERRFGRRFVELTTERQDELLQTIQQGNVEADVWQDVPAERFFTMLLKTVAGIYYAHPAAWNEIGYGGPASPRGYVRLDANQRDSWEAKEEQDG
jgi:hypothetical protein